MTMTGASLLTGLSQFMGDYWASSTTSTSSPSTDQLIDTSLASLGEDDVIKDWFVRITAVGTYQWNVRRVVSFTAETGTILVEPDFSSAIGSTVSYELHRYDPRGKFTALDEARIRVSPLLGEIVYHEQYTGDGRTTSFTIPSTMRTGPAFVREESPCAVETDWNFLGHPRLDDTSVWTASSATLSTATKTNLDPYIPKYDTTCITVAVAASTAATVTQTVANMGLGITAAAAAGRRVTFALWFYSRVTSKVRLRILTDAGTLATSAAYHNGNGWELLTVSGNVAGTNAATLSAQIVIDSTSDALFGAMNRGWFYFGEPDTVTDLYHGSKPRRVRRDSETQRVYLDFVPQRGHQLQLVGKDVLSALGTTATTQVTNTMEVDEPAAQLLYAHAAQIIFERDGLNAADTGEVGPRIAVMLGRAKEYETKFPFRLPEPNPIKGPWLA